MHCKHIILCTN